MDLSTAEARLHEVKTRRLEIAATLAEWKRAYIVDGMPRPLSDRVTLEAEDAALALEARRLAVVANDAMQARRQAINARLLPQLLALLKERGHDDLIAEAEQRSAAAMAEAAESTR